MKLAEICEELTYTCLQGEMEKEISDIIYDSRKVEKDTVFVCMVGAVVDGHDFKELLAAFDKAKTVKGQPTVIIAKTVKGKGVSFMENVCDFHGKAPSKEETAKAVEELSCVCSVE